MTTTIECAITAETRQTHYDTSADRSESVLVTLVRYPSILNRIPGHPDWRMQSVGVFVNSVLVEHYMAGETVPYSLRPYVEHALSIAGAEQ